MLTTKKITLDGIEMDEDFAKVYDACLDIVSVFSGHFETNTPEDELLRGMAKAIIIYRTRKKVES